MQNELYIDEVDPLQIINVRISAITLIDILSEGHISEATEVISGLPEGVQLVGAKYDYACATVVLTFRHPSFEKISVEEWLAGEIPELDITIKNLDEEVKLFGRIIGYIRKRSEGL